MAEALPAMPLPKGLGQDRFLVDGFGSPCQRPHANAMAMTKHVGTRVLWLQSASSGADAEAVVDIELYCQAVFSALDVLGGYVRDAWAAAASGASQQTSGACNDNGVSANARLGAAHNPTYGLQRHIGSGLHASHAA